MVEADLIPVVLTLRLRLTEPDRAPLPPEVPNGLPALALHLGHPVPAERAEEITVKREAALDRRYDQVDVVNSTRAHG